ncbi:MAG: MATE family efflux transporter, partial [Nannocystaceae bacterium]
GINWFFEFAAFTLFINVIVADLGTTVLAAMMAVMAINSVSFMPAFGISSSGAILVGQAIGSGNSDRVPGIVRRTASVTMVWQGVVSLVYLAIPGVLMTLFATSGEQSDKLLAVGTALLMISVAWQLFDAVGMSVGEALRAAGDTAWPMWARLCIAWFVFMPAGYLSVTVYGGGHVAAMLCVVGYLALLSGFLGYRFMSGAWRKIDLTGDGVPGH